MRSDQALLQALGERLRSVRERAGFSVSDLARESGASRRHITETEAGRANLSFLKLARLAETLGCSLADVCDVPLRTSERQRIALVGLRGAGKSTVGRALALEREVPFIELDERVEELAGMSLAEIFELHGVEAYRRFEREALEEVLSSGDRLVIATGGSIVTSPESFERLKQACRTVWLRTSPTEHLRRVEAQGDMRPMAGRPRAQQELESILAERLAAYASCDDELDTTGRSVESLVARIDSAPAE